MAATSNEGDVSAEIHFAQRLAANEKKIRDRAMKKLRKWIELKSSNGRDRFTESDILKIWKGLHYCMWMQDKPLIQEELADNIAQLVHVFGNMDTALLFVDVFYQTEAREWNGIDRWRLDKFMMLVRRILEQSLKLLQNHKWKKSLIESVVQIMKKRIMSVEEDRISDGLKIHFTDIYLDELEKVGAEVLTAKQVIHLLEPFSTFLPKATNTVLLKRVISRIYTAIVEQSVDDAMKAAERQLEREEADDDENKDSDEERDDDDDDDDDLPPRLEYDFDAIADRLFELGKDHSCVARNRAKIYQVVKQFRDLAGGILPENKEEDFDPKKGFISKTEFSHAVHRLQSLEMSTIKKKTKKRKKSKESNDQTEISQSENETRKKPRLDETQATKGEEEEKTGQMKKGKHPASAAERFTSVKKKNSPQVNGGDLTEACENGVKKKANKRKSDQSLDSENLSEKVKTKKGEVSDTSGSIKKRKTEDPQIGTVTPKGKKKKDLCCAGAENGQCNDSAAIEASVVTKKGKASKPKIKGGNKSNLVLDSSLEAKETNSESVKKAKSEKSKKVKSSDPDTDNSESKGKSEVSENGDIVEIWVPNKKYKGKLKEQFEEQVRKAEGSEKSAKKGDKGSPFAEFEKLNKTPPAFVRKSLSKVQLSKSEPRKKVQKRTEFSTPNPSVTDKKRVSFDMKKNKALGFQQSIIFSPDPFNPDKKPDQSILKTPDGTSKAKTTKVGKARLSAGKKADSATKRAKASDFF